MPLRLLILNGPNLNLLGTRQPEVYGGTTLSEIIDNCQTYAKSLGAELTAKQSNTEGELVNIIQDAKGQTDGIILNAGAYTHTSIAIADAISGVEIPTIELHLSNVHAREEFRHKSYLSPVVLGQIAGFGANGYLLAMTAMVQHLQGSGNE